MSDDSFIKRVERLFPDHNMVGYGNTLGRFLVDNRISFSGEEIINAFKNGTEKELIYSAERAFEIDKLISEFNGEVRNIGRSL